MGTPKLRLEDLAISFRGKPRTCPLSWWKRFWRAFRSLDQNATPFQYDFDDVSVALGSLACLEKMATDTGRLHGVIGRVRAVTAFPQLELRALLDKFQARRFATEYVDGLVQHQQINSTPFTLRLANTDIEVVMSVTYTHCGLDVFGQDFHTLEAEIEWGGGARGPLSRRRMMKQEQTAFGIYYSVPGYMDGRIPYRGDQPECLAQGWSFPFMYLDTRDDGVPPWFDGLRQSCSVELFLVFHRNSLAEQDPDDPI